MPILIDVRLFHDHIDIVFVVKALEKHLQFLKSYLLVWDVILNLEFFDELGVVLQFFNGPSFFDVHYIHQVFWFE